MNQQYPCLIYLKQSLQEFRDTINYLFNVPSICVWTIFNEGWGQFNADKMYEICKSIDDSRLYDATSGWFKQSKSDFDSLHIYFRNKHLTPETRPLLLSECGGYVYSVDNAKAKWGYAICKSKQELTDKIIKMYEEMVIPSIDDGLCGVIFTQISDVEGEINGLYSFDRKILKVDKDRIKKISDTITKYLER